MGERNGGSVAVGAIQISSIFFSTTTMRMVSISNCSMQV